MKLCGASATETCVYPSGHGGVCSYHKPTNHAPTEFCSLEHPDFICDWKDCPGRGTPHSTHSAFTMPAATSEAHEIIEPANAPQQNAPITSQNAPELTLNMGDPAPSTGATAGMDLNEARRIVESFPNQIEALRSALAHAQAELDEAQALADRFCTDAYAFHDERDQLRTDLAHAQAGQQAAVSFVGVNNQAIAALTAEADQLRAQVEALRGVVRKHYPTIAGRVTQLRIAREYRAADAWDAVAQDFYAALGAATKPE